MQLNPMEDARLDNKACLEYLSGKYDFDLLPSIPSIVSFPVIAEVLQVSLPTVIKLVETKKLPVLRLENESYAVLKSDLIQFILDNFSCLKPVKFDENKGKKGKKMPQIDQNCPK